MAEEQKYSVVSLDGIGNVANNLINKIASAIGWIIDRETPQKVAIDTYIQEIQNSDKDPLIKAALISSTKKIMKEYCNQHDIVKIAMSELNEQSKPEELEDDWIALFMEKAKLISDKDFQLILGKVLATECQDKKSIPKSLIYILSQMDREDAETFTTLCSLSVKIEGKDYPLDMDLKGLSSGYVTECESKPVKVSYYESEIELNKDKNPIGNIIFTKAGDALSRNIVPEKQEGFWKEYCIPVLKEAVAKK